MSVLDLHHGVCLARRAAHGSCPHPGGRCALASPLLLAATARRLRRMTRQSGQMSPSSRKRCSRASAASSVAGPLAPYTVFDVPPEWRRLEVDPTGASMRAAPSIDWQAEASHATPPSFAYRSLAELFPEAEGLGSEFNSNARFRRALRTAARDDFQEVVPGGSSGSRPLPDAKDGSVQAFVGHFVERDRLRLRPMPRLTQALRDHGFTLSGQAFIGRLLELCNGVCCGSWADIIGPPRSSRWHQDEGRNTYTVMLGFPPASGYAGDGVFTRVARISHRLCPVGLGIPVEVDFAIPEECTFRPVYAPGQEIVVYNDGTLLHRAPESRAPESPSREALWRLM
eukprot:CAMPEP_0175224012 /NCGR_PEP_ID=MMETSP0093-20121207/21629_1 /TAXON_ID=311494 /ORGANISM="Alexandrium monilatum, Strain CCMP3105" /LENGTH=340 /DNA_ID=CAMNT_0016517635 /DNA_START=15 /DNA_END=1037 /DNA_ORIENTATION=+